jgi:hypothetical protein
VIFANENSKNSKKTKFWKEKSVEDVVTLGPTAHMPHYFYSKLKKMFTLLEVEMVVLGVS